MSTQPRPAALDLPFASLPMASLLVAQFLSALADNALLIIAIALMKQLGEAGRIPWVQESFILPFILLAPFAGPFADALPKGRVMLIGNVTKLAGTSLMFVGVYPVLAYLLVGAGATIYSPAKYGILSQFFGPASLVRANSMLEGSTIAAILLGVVAGGWLSDGALSVALAIIVGIYAAATAANLLIPKLSPERPAGVVRPMPLIVEFLAALRRLVTDREARMSLLGTSLFWGSGATLRLMLFAWVPTALSIAGNSTPANLMGAVSVGIVGGASLAAIAIRLETVRRAFIGGLAVGPAILLLAGQTELVPSALLLGAIGVCGGVFVVPLNALLQERGHETVGAGRALAIQNLLENSAMLLMVGGYGLSNRLPITGAVSGFGLLMLAGIAGLAWSTRQKGREAPC
jgi:MFS transporter, LPLT family, lysophospholipid transporter